MNDIDSNLTTNNKKVTFWDFFKKFFKVGGIYFALLVLVIISGIISPESIDPSHMLDVLRNATILGIISIGQTLLIITRGLDLSVGAHITLTNILIAGVSLGKTENTLHVVILALLVGAAIGLFNGVLVVYLKIEPLVGSLGVMLLIQGIIFLYTKGFAKGFTPSLIRIVGIGKIYNFFPVSIVVLIIIALVVFLILRRTVFGRYIYSVGSNPNAAHFAGIKVVRVRLLVYLISGVLTAIAGIIWSGFIGTPTHSGGDYLAFDSIAAVVIGGTTFAGGKGGIGGTIIGAIMLVYLSSFLTIAGLSAEWKIISQGLIILVLVFGYTGRKIYK